MAREKFSHEERVQGVEAILRYVFNDKEKCLEALQADFWPKNNRLALLGDGILEVVLRAAWYETNLEVGTYTNIIHNGAASNKALTIRGRNLGIDRFIIVNPGQDTASDKLVATALEALIGAVKVDGGDAAAATVIEYLGFLSVVTNEVKKFHQQFGDVA
ncbi:ribonuclease III [Delitschia confertaspora ATCC 74209]|uniref:Ribonuclease III n=1 Tax=Delitschia confertaspora ATCC 74209 TaxID=1513339 RepID=A0A9P4MUL1_9PLEO|nr:ribonuclease III [Delitschia confertaspora ATCC 74209]